MSEQLFHYFYSKPGRITQPGRLLVLLGAFLIMVGFFGRLATTTINILPTLAQQRQTDKSLAEIYPTLPLWWVPESIAGGALCVLLIAGGLLIFFYGKSVDRAVKAA